MCCDDDQGGRGNEHSEGRPGIELAEVQRPPAQQFNDYSGSAGSAHDQRDGESYFEGKSLPQLFDESRVETLVRWMRKLECFELPMSSLDEAIRIVRGRCL